MKKSTVLFVLLSNLFFGCTFFKESALDPNSPLNDLLGFLRLGTLVDNLTNSPDTIILFTFRDGNNIPFASHQISYSVNNEADTNGVPTSLFGESGNVQEYSQTLDSTGTGTLFFSERGLAKVILFNTNVPPEAIGEFTFRVYPDLGKEQFQILSQTGDFQVVVQDISSFRNGYGGTTDYLPLGVVNGRSFLYFETFTNFVLPDGSLEKRGHIASSPDGIVYDTVTDISGLNLYSFPPPNALARQEALPSRVAFDGINYHVFLSVKEYDNAGSPLGTTVSRVLIPSFFTPREVQALPTQLATNIDINPDLTFSPFFFFQGKLVTMLDDGISALYPALMDVDGGNVIDLNGPAYSCNLTNESFYTTLQVFTQAGLPYLFCGEGAINTSLYNFRAVPGNNLNSATNQDFTIATFVFDAPPVVVDNNLVLANSTSGVYLMDMSTFPGGTSTSTFLPNTNTSIGDAITPNFRFVRSSGGAHFGLTASDPALTSIFDIEIIHFRNNFTNNLVIPAGSATPPVSDFTFSGSERWQSLQGNFFVQWMGDQTIDLGATFLRAFKVANLNLTNNTWPEIPQLVKIRQTNF